MIQKDKTMITATTKGAAACAAMTSLLFKRPLEITSTTNTTFTKPITRFTIKTRSIHVKVVCGPHEGSRFHLRPTKRRPCLVGSSSARSFRKNGISLPKDEMVSINQGRFRQRDGGMYYTDNDRSGTKVVQKTSELDGNVPLLLKGNVPLLLKEGMELTVGGSILKISFVGGCDEEYDVKNV